MELTTTVTVPSHPQPLQLLVGEGKNAKYVKGGICYYSLLTFVLPFITFNADKC